MTLSNRITLAGAIPLLVAIAAVLLLAVIALTPSNRANAAADAGTCNLSPVLLDMLLERYQLAANKCDNLNLAGATAPDITHTRDADHAVDTWDLSGKDLTSFAISKDDATILRALTETTSVTEAGVLYIDLTGNPLAVEDVSFANIPSTVAVILSAEAPVSGFQTDEHTVTEASADYLAVAFPGLNAGDDDLQVVLTISGADYSSTTANIALTSATPAIPNEVQLISVGDGTGTTRNARVSSGSDSEIFYWPLTVGKDNVNEGETDFKIEIGLVASPTPALTGFKQSIIDDFELANIEIDVTVIDADEPSLSVCERSEDVEAAILLAVTNDANSNGRVDAGEVAADGFGGHNECDELTLRDLGSITALLTIDDADDDNEPIVNLIAGDFEGLTGLTRLHIEGASSLPSGIFSGVGSADGNTQVEITFAKNSPTDEDVETVGGFTPSTIPAHIFDDQEPKQVFVLADDTDDAGKGVTSGLDSSLYAGVEGDHFFVLTNAATAAYVLSNSVNFDSTQLDVTNADAANPLRRPTITDRGAGEKLKGARVVRFAVQVLPDDKEDKGDRTTWLFLFPTDSDVQSGTDTTLDPPTSAANLEDFAVVAVTDDD